MTMSTVRARQVPDFCAGFWGLLADGDPLGAVAVLHEAEIRVIEHRALGEAWPLPRSTEKR